MDMSVNARIRGTPSVETTQDTKFNKINQNGVKFASLLSLSKKLNILD